MMTRAGVNWISTLGAALGSPLAQRTDVVGGDVGAVLGAEEVLQQDLQLYGRRAEPSTASSRKISYDASPTRSVSRLPKLFADTVIRLLHRQVFRQNPPALRKQPAR
ncbi:hypothetical protein GCM10020220_043400 [Nonomuraea rubra]